MRLYQEGDTGEPVRDIQDRLVALGIPSRADPPGEFGEGTRRAVSDFQSSRGLDVDGVIGPDTWRALYEAGYRLGDRLLFLRRPMLRGEDVAEVQSRLNGLGFDAGKVDGIFGTHTEGAILDFQRNRHLAEDGKAGPEVTTELRLVTRAAIRAGRETVREMEWLRARPATVVGARVYFDPSCRNDHEAASTWTVASTAAVLLQERGGVPLLSRSNDVMLPERIRAQRANRMGAELIVSIAHTDDAPAVYYYSSDHGRSEVGSLLATAIGERLGLTVDGRATPMLKETRAPAVVVASGSLDASTGSGIFGGLERFLSGTAVRVPVGP